MAWFDLAWSGRFKITSVDAQVAEAIDNLYYDLALAPAEFWTTVHATDGRDIRVTQADEVTEVAREVSGFVQASSVGSLYFVATGLSASADTDFYVYYGNPAATEPAAGAANGKNAVWASYLGVWHMDDASSPATDSRSTNDAAGTTGVTYASTGKLRTGIDFNGTTGWVSAGDVLDITSASLTFSAWINPRTLGESSGGRIIQKCVEGTDLNGYRFNMLTGTDRLNLTIGDAAAFTAGTSSNSAVAFNVLQHVVVTYNGANARFYKNAVAFGAPALTRVPTAGTTPLLFGNSNIGGAGIRTFDGVIDEVRMSTQVRSANWITTEYNNQNNPGTFWTTGAAEGGEPVPLIAPSTNRIARQSGRRRHPSVSSPGGFF